MGVLKSQRGILGLVFGLVVVESGDESLLVLSSMLARTRGYMFELSRLSFVNKRQGPRI